MIERVVLASIVVMMMGLWFLASAFGQLAAGKLGAEISQSNTGSSLLSKLQSYTDGYYQLAIYALIAGLVLILISRKVIKLMKNIEKNGKEDELLEFIQYLDICIPKFYKILSLRENILKKYSEDKFWDYINEKIMEEDINNLEKENLTKYIGILKKNKITYDKCELFFYNKSK
jgi:hypothetical protein